MNKFFLFLIVISVLGFAACEKVEPEEEPFLANAFALQNDSGQQFLYSMEKLDNDSFHLFFEAATNGEFVPGQIHFYIAYTDTMDTLWLTQSSLYWHAYSDVIGDKYTLDTLAKNYVLFQSNLPLYDLSKGVFQAHFLIDTTFTKIDTLSPDTMRIDSGSFSGGYFE